MIVPNYSTGMGRIYVVALTTWLSLHLPLPASATCSGDCNGDNSVTVDELLTMVNIALGNAPVTDCEAGDGGGDGEITIDEILTAVNNALDGCPVALRIGSASGAPGARVRFGVTLGTAGQDVFGTDNEFTFQPNARVAANGLDPDCAVNSAIKKRGTFFVFLPNGCSGLNCTGVRAFVTTRPGDSVDPIPDGAELYGCNVTISGNALPGDLPLTCGRTEASAGAPGGGSQLVTADCTNGAIRVVVP